MAYPQTAAPYMAQPGWAGQVPGGGYPEAYNYQHGQYYAGYQQGAASSGATAGYPGYDYSSYYQGYQQPMPESAGQAPTASASASAAPPPPPADGEAPPPPPPPPPDAAPGDDPPPGTAPAPTPPPAPPVSTSTAPSPAPPDQGAPGYDAQYAQWYQQQYAAYSGYGYPQQQDQAAYHAYWQQQQHSAAGPQTAYGQQTQAQSYQQQMPRLNIPGPQPPKGPPPPSAYPQHTPSAPAAASKQGSYNEMPPPSNLYPQQQQHAHSHQQQTNGSAPHQQHKPVFLTGTNNVPIGGRPAGSAAASSLQQQGKQQGGPPGLVIRPQMPQRPAAAPAYVSAVPSTQHSASSMAPSSIAAKVAAAAADAARAVAAAQQQQRAASHSATGTAAQFPPSFTSWVTRCFNAAKLRAIPDAKVSACLMTFLDKVKAEGRLWTTDWDTHKVLLPDELQQTPPGERRSSYSHDGYGRVEAPSPTSASRKRHRWGAPPSERDATQDADTDEEDHHHHAARSQSHSHGHSTHGEDHHDVEHLSNRQRKRLRAQQHLQPHARGSKAAAMHGPTAEELRRRARAGRFGSSAANGGGRWGGSGSDSGDGDYDDDGFVFGGGAVVGTCQGLEKSYFRLTGQPDPSTVRPEPVLEKALARLVALLAKGDVTYFYAFDQFKGMRQDCTVQHLRNGLAARVYEAHARSCLEYGDLAEFNQCQTRLGHLYADAQVPGCRAEFLAYRLLYETVYTSLGKATMAKALMHTMRNVPQELAAEPEIKHALQVRAAVMSNNYASFFRLYASAPNLGRAIMDGCSANVRWTGLNAFVKACDLPVPVAAMAQLLGFVPRASTATAVQDGQSGEPRVAPLPGCQHAECAGAAAAESSQEEGVAACEQWLRDHGAELTEKGGELLLDTKASRGKLFIPEPPKVAHGDENLSLTDFLSRASGLADGMEQ